MDEPFNELDPNLRREMRRFVKDMHEEYGFTAVLVTHDREEAFELSNKIAVMRNGEIVEIAEKNNLYKRPKTLATARFLGERNLFPYTLEDNGIRIGKSFLNIKGLYESGYVMIPERSIYLQKPQAKTEWILEMPSVVLRADNSRKGQELVLNTEMGHIFAFNYGYLDIAVNQSLTLFIDTKAMHFLMEE